MHVKLISREELTNSWNGFEKCTSNYWDISKGQGGELKNEVDVLQEMLLLIYRWSIVMIWATHLFINIHSQNLMTVGLVSRYLFLLHKYQNKGHSVNYTGPNATSIAVQECALLLVNTAQTFIRHRHVFIILFEANVQKSIAGFWIQTKWKCE